MEPKHEHSKKNSYDKKKNKYSLRTQDKQLRQSRQFMEHIY